MNTFPNELIDWYRVHRRDLAWRKTKDPYAIWLSEIILQQTRVEQGTNYYHRFLNRFPKIQDLAEADEQEVLNLWQGLGYYSRARNLHKTAKLVASMDSFPSTSSELIQLPGIGPYTSAAIAAFAFGEAVPVLDGNVFRFVSRYLAIESDPSDTQAQSEIRSFLEKEIPKDDASTFNQALMEFGSLHCKASKPLCESCPFQSDCIAFKDSKVTSIPKKKKAKERRKRYFDYMVISTDSQVLIQKRKGSDIWENMFEFPLIESDEEPDDATLISRIPDGIKSQVVFGQRFKRKKHLLSHQEIYSSFLLLAAKETFAVSDKKWISFQELEDHPLPRIIDKFLEEQAVLEGKKAKFV